MAKSEIKDSEVVEENEEGNNYSDNSAYNYCCGCLCSQYHRLLCPAQPTIG